MRMQTPLHSLGTCGSSANAEAAPIFRNNATELASALLGGVLTHFLAGLVSSDGSQSGRQSVWTAVGSLV